MERRKTADENRSYSVRLMEWIEGAEENRKTEGETERKGEGGRRVGGGKEDGCEGEENEEGKTAAKGVMGVEKE